MLTATATIVMAWRNITDYRPGDRVEVEGETADASFCVPGPTIEIGQIRTAG
jgi:hypothetical protein